MHDAMLQDNPDRPKHDKVHEGERNANMPESNQAVRITIHPTGTVLTALPGTPLRQLLFEQGVEFPCGGHGRCRGCRVRALSGQMSVNAAQRERLSPSEIEAGWRLACQCMLEGDLTLALRHWDAAILANDSEFAFTPQPGYGIAIDLGTTTLVAQLLDLQTGDVLGVKTALNPQARHGADVMSRIEFAVAEQGAELLTSLIRKEIGSLIQKLVRGAERDAAEVRRVVIVGNTVMHHLFGGINLEPLSHVPFEPEQDGLLSFKPEELGWEALTAATVDFLPCLGSFVGSDILAGMLATGLHESDSAAALIDLGTNGEIVVGNREGLLCASTAAGPAFEGARIEMGMRAATGAIYKVMAKDGRLVCETLGGVPAVGICGSGLVDAAAAALEAGLLLPSGRIADRKPLLLAEEVTLTQTDIRQLQLAKGAIAAGVRMLLNRLGLLASEVRTVYLAGAFGNYVSLSSAIRIGLLPFEMEQIAPAGNTALLGAKMALFIPDRDALAFYALRGNVEHFALHTDRAFQDAYVEAMSFPA
jgi:uncharacterized 2Fe-2S/4Fe-4S cluster protein (DUF4445 family)